MAFSVASGGLLHDRAHQQEQIPKLPSSSCRWVPVSGLHLEYESPRFCHSAITGAAQDEHLMVQSLLQEKDQFRQPAWNWAFPFAKVPEW